LSLCSQYGPISSPIGTRSPMLGSASAWALSYSAVNYFRSIPTNVITVPKRYRRTDGQTDGQTDDMQSHNRALRIASRGKKQAALTAETCFSRLRIYDIITPRSRTCPLALMVSPPSLIAGPQPPSLQRLCREPDHGSSVNSGLSLRRLADIN